MLVAAILSRHPPHVSTYPKRLPLPVHLYVNGRTIRGDADALFLPIERWVPPPNHHDVFVRHRIATRSDEQQFKM